MRSVLCVVAVVLLTGCAKFYWTKPSATPQEFSQDSLTCARASITYQEQARGGGAFSSNGAGGFTHRASAGHGINETLYKLCLREKGWGYGKYVTPPPGSYRGLSDEF